MSRGGAHAAGVPALAAEDEVNRRDPEVAQEVERFDRPQIDDGGEKRGARAGARSCGHHVSQRDRRPADSGRRDAGHGVAHVVATRQHCSTDYSLSLITIFAIVCSCMFEVPS